MGVIYIDMGDLAPRLRAESKKMGRCVDVAMKLAAIRFAKHLRRIVQEMAISDTKEYEKSFRVRFVNGRVIVENTAPHAGFLEMGTPPHPVSIEGQHAIKEWAMRKLGLNEKEADRATFLICRKIRMFGQQPLYIIRRALPMLLKIFADELKNVIKKDKSS